MTEIVKDVRKDIDTLRSEMSKRPKKKTARDWADEQVAQANAAAAATSASGAGGSGAGSSGAAARTIAMQAKRQTRNEQRTELRALCKEARQRERGLVETILQRSNIVLSTCIGAGSKLLNKVDFDLVVIDEAAQGLEAACWIPILKVRSERSTYNNSNSNSSGGGRGKCVLAGDHCQLPPTIKSAEAEKGGLGVTLFERIIKDARFRQVVRLLDTQYRMNWRISDWASHNMYHDAIKSHASVAEHTLRDIIGTGTGMLANSTTATASGAIASTKVDCDDDVQVGNEEEDTAKLTSTLATFSTSATGVVTTERNAGNANDRIDEEEDAFPVLLLVDTSGLGMLEDSSSSANNVNNVNNATNKNSSSHRNFHEAELVKQHVLSLVRAGVKPSQVGGWG